MCFVGGKSLHISYAKKRPGRLLAPAHGPAGPYEAPNKFLLLRSDEHVIHVHRVKVLGLVVAVGVENVDVESAARVAR